LMLLDDNQCLPSDFLKFSVVQQVDESHPSIPSATPPDTLLEKR
jgi:hypothetical protein